MRILRRADYRTIPWKNGRGVAHQIAARPEGADYDRLDWQVSRPEIREDGPFSSLPGLDRQFMLVAGNGVELHCRGDGADFVKRIDAPFEAFAFRGDWDVTCRLLDGPVQVLNVMTRRGRTSARLEVRDITAMTPVAKPGDEVLVIYLGTGKLTAYGAFGTDSLAADDSFVLDEARPTECALAPVVGAPARVVLVRLAQ